MTRRSPNPEQRKAIEHNGGVLLSAGAGSGKTFVLVEHIIFLIHQVIKKEKHTSEIDFTKVIRNELSKIVLMTFTKKAAGELALRLHARINDELSYVTEDVKKWEMAKEAISYMTVSTIHGFCFKLLKQGFFSNFDPDINIISDAESKHRVKELFNNFFEDIKNKPLGKSERFEIILSNKRSLLNSLCFIFGDPTLRLMWKKFNVEKDAEVDFEKFIFDYFKIAGWSKAIEDIPSLSNYSEYSTKKWYLFLDKFLSLYKTNKIKDLDSYNNYLELFNEFKGVRAPMAKLGLHSINDAMNTLKEVRSFLADNADHFGAYLENSKGAYLDWAMTFKNIFNYIEDHYLDIPGVTFSDLEYYVYQGLQKESSVERISKAYEYFIVDEFQDTSEIQFSILESLTSRNYDKLFCVGDMKQAIYGFRGGELAVFKKCMQQVPLNLSMRNNYRSLEEVINFNNFLFDDIFKKGLGFKGVDDQAVDVEYQEDPLPEREDKGRIYKIKAEIECLSEEKSKLSPSEINFQEADILINKIREIKINEPQERVCILYKNLTPAKFLISKLISNKLSFSAQVKVPLSEDPIVGILKVLLEIYMDFGKKVYEDELSYASIMLANYLKYLNVDYKGEIKSLVFQFYRDIKTLGLLESFKKFSYSLDFSNSNYPQNSNLIESISSLANDNIEMAWEAISDNIENKYSIDFQFGEDPNGIIIMTAHASKGLEFEHVFLGGIHTNGRRMPNTSYFGKLPGSYRWKSDFAQKKPFKAPLYIYEELLNKKKDFAESKRLFYVACTRAQKTLTWVDLSYEGKEVSTSKDSWINGIRSFENDMPEVAIKTFEQIKTNLQDQKVSKIEEEEKLASLSSNKPFFHQDRMGIIEKNKVDENLDISLGVLAELSVTRLTSLCECPRKFYLQNICKFDQNEIQDLVGDSSHFENDVKFNVEEKSLESEEIDFSDFTSNKIVSSAERGTAVHEALSQAIKRNFIIPKWFVDQYSDKDQGVVSWTLKELKNKYEDSKYISEEPIKFPFFGHMISGTPDLIIQGEDRLAIWDFKTGARGESKEIPYWFQLNAYAYAAYVLGLIPMTEKIDLVLAYVDQNDLVTQSTNYHDVASRLYRDWSKLAYLDQVNLEHCSKCPYEKLCHSDGLSCTDSALC